MADSIQLLLWKLSGNCLYLLQCLLRCGELLGDAGKLVEMGLMLGLQIGDFY